MNILEKATINIKDILITNYKIEKNNKVIIVYDEKSILSSILKEASKLALKELKNDYEEIEFFEEDSENIADLVFEKTKKEDIIILIQSTSFRVSKYRWRNELCFRGLKVVEFGHLHKVKEDEIMTFIKSLDCDFEHYVKITNKIIPLIEKSKKIKFISTDGSILKYEKEMDKCLENIGQLWNQTNWTTRFPIGEIISEAKDLSTLNGEMLIYGYPKTDGQITVFTQPFKCKIENGFVISHEGPKEFEEIIEMIKKENEENLVYVRELGLGLNRGIKRFDLISEPMAYERVEGLHFSLGMKHGMYQKKLWPKYGKNFYQRYHIDIFIDVKEIFIDGIKIFDAEKGYF